MSRSDVGHGGQPALRGKREGDRATSITRVAASTGPAVERRVEEPAAPCDVSSQLGGPTSAGLQQQRLASWTWQCN